MSSNNSQPTDGKINMSPNQSPPLPSSPTSEPQVSQTSGDNSSSLEGSIGPETETDSKEEDVASEEPSTDRPVQFALSRHHWRSGEHRYGNRKRKINSLVESNLNDQPNKRSRPERNTNLPLKFEGSRFPIIENDWENKIQSTSKDQSSQTPFVRLLNPPTKSTKRRLPPNPNLFLSPLQQEETKIISESDTQQIMMIKYAEKFDEIVTDALGMNVQHAQTLNEIQELPYPEPKHRWGAKGPKTSFDPIEVNRYGLRDSYSFGHHHFPPKPTLIDRSDSEPGTSQGCGSFSSSNDSKIQTDEKKEDSEPEDESEEEEL